MAFSGIFPSTELEKVPAGELSIVLCQDCCLAQLDRDFPGDEMYGDNYGYMSSLNNSMVNHLGQIVAYLEDLAQLKPGDLVLDIGSNDGTMLSLYKTNGITRVGMDPTIAKYKALYPADVITVPSFFSADAFDFASPGTKAKLVSTVAMLYDLPDPARFAEEIRRILKDDGFWHIEVSYGPWMLESGAFDAVCHEHVEYYSLKTLKRILDGAGMKIVSISFNDTNGGSISVTSTPVENLKNMEAVEKIAEITALEKESKCNELSGWRLFDSLVKSRISDLEKFLIEAKNQGKRVVGLGASTKGNVLLQSLSPDAVSSIGVIGEVNSFKFGKLTPGTRIPIVPENEVIDSSPDFVLVLPWHFKSSFDARLVEYISGGGRVVYPLPELEVVG
jgi:SAM-dependent methyltransferase